MPLLVIRATRSLTFDDPSLERLLAVAPSADVVEIDSGHDLAQGAPDELIAAVRAFLS